MLPTRAYSDALSSLIPSTARQAPAEERSVIVLAVDRADLTRYPLPSLTRLPAHTTADALALIERAQPRVVAVDWDCHEIDGDQVVRAARRSGRTGILVATSAVEHAPSAIKCGCHTLLLKPFAPNLAAGRIGRLCREMSAASIGRRPTISANDCSTHRTWANTVCPKCQTPGATSFEYSSYRRMWYACLACDAVWLGPRQE
jgi:DNA-binding response OmpR family regulator